MSGTKEGGKRASATNRAKFGSDYYREIGSLGGKKKNPNKGFGSMDKEKVKAAGKLGGSISKPRKRKPAGFSMEYEDIHSKPETKKLVYDTSNLGVDSNSVPNSGGVLRRTITRLVKK